jgi:hypothetical protein
LEMRMLSQPSKRVSQSDDCLSQLTKAASTGPYLRDRCLGSPATIGIRRSDQRRSITCKVPHQPLGLRRTSPAWDKTYVCAVAHAQVRCVEYLASTDRRPRSGRFAFRYRRRQDRTASPGTAANNHQSARSLSSWHRHALASNQSNVAQGGDNRYFGPVL